MLQLSETQHVGFVLLSSAQTGVTFTNHLPEQRHLTNQILPNGSGVAAGDIDGDGRCDLFFCGLSSQSRLYRNLGGWRFEDVTRRAGVECANLDATGATFADVDGDGDLDLVVNSIAGGTHLFLNDGRGRFTEVGEVLNLVYCWWLHGLPLVQMRRLVRIAEMSRQEFIRGHCPQEQP